MDLIHRFTSTSTCRNGTSRYRTRTRFHSGKGHSSFGEVLVCSKLLSFKLFLSPSYSPEPDAKTLRINLRSSATSNNGIGKETAQALLKGALCCFSGPPKSPKRLGSFRAPSGYTIYSEFEKGPERAELARKDMDFFCESRTIRIWTVTACS